MGRNVISCQRRRLYFLARDEKTKRMGGIVSHSGAVCLFEVAVLCDAVVGLEESDSL